MKNLAPYPSSHLSRSQVEFANVILLNKADLATEADLAELEALVLGLNPAARVVRTVSSDVSLVEVLGTGKFDLDEASQAAGWLQVQSENQDLKTPFSYIRVLFGLRCAIS